MGLGKMRIYWKYFPLDKSNIRASWKFKRNSRVRKFHFGITVFILQLKHIPVLDREDGMVKGFTT